MTRTKRLVKNKTKLEKIIDEQNKRLDFHENPHMPFSKQNYLHQDTVEEEKGKSKGKGRGKGKGKKTPDKNEQQKGTRRGGIKNHTGKTQIFKPTKTQKHTADKCPRLW